jgi:hypothetical protein
METVGPGEVDGTGSSHCVHDCEDRLRFGSLLVRGQRVCVACGLPVLTTAKGSRGQSPD